MHVGPLHIRIKSRDSKCVPSWRSGGSRKCLLLYHDHLMEQMLAIRTSAMCCRHGSMYVSDLLLRVGPPKKIFDFSVLTTLLVSSNLLPTASSCNPVGH